MSDQGRSGGGGTSGWRISVPGNLQERIGEGLPQVGEAVSGIMPRIIGPSTHHRAILSRLNSQGERTHGWRRGGWQRAKCSAGHGGQWPPLQPCWIRDERPLSDPADDERRESERHYGRRRTSWSHARGRATSTVHPATLAAEFWDICHYIIYSFDVGTYARSVGQYSHLKLF